MIDAGQSRLIATQLTTHQRATMGATVLDHLQLAFTIAQQDDRNGAYTGGLEVAGLRHFDMPSPTKLHSGPRKMRCCSRANQTGSVNRR